MGKLSKAELAELVFSQFECLQLNYPTFQLALASDGNYLLDGALAFDTQIEGRVVQGQFQIGVTVPPSYPAKPPTAKETGGKIPPTFHRYTDSQNMCLAAPVEIIRVFRGDQTLNGFVSNLVLPYLINFRHQEKYGSLPFGELAHGYKGILAYYQTRFATKTEPTIRLLKILADNKVERHVECPCGTGRSVRDCHYENLKELSRCFSFRQFRQELLGILSWCNEHGHLRPSGEFMPLADRRRRRKKLETLIGKRK